jgi:hypothetical protein
MKYSIMLSLRAKIRPVFPDLKLRYAQLPEKKTAANLSRGPEKFGDSHFVHLILEFRNQSNGLGVSESRG